MYRLDLHKIFHTRASDKRYIQRPEICGALRADQVTCAGPKTKGYVHPSGLALSGGILVWRVEMHEVLHTCSIKEHPDDPKVKHKTDPAKNQGDGEQPFNIDLKHVKSSALVSLRMGQIQVPHI
jgi:hypothetical protein